MGSTNKEEIEICQPNLLNDSSKEPEGYNYNSTSSAKNYGWFWASVEVHI